MPNGTGLTGARMRRTSPPLSKHCQNVNTPYSKGHIHAYEYLERHGRDYIRLATTGGEHFPDVPLSIDHVTLVTVDDEDVDIANLKMSGILNKTGHIPLNSNGVCFELAACRNDQ